MAAGADDWEARAAAARAADPDNWLVRARRAVAEEKQRERDGLMFLFGVAATLIGQWLLFVMYRHPAPLEWDLLVRLWIGSLMGVPMGAALLITLWFVPVWVRQTFSRTPAEQDD